MVWFFGPPNVENLKTKRDIKRLTKALRYMKAGYVRLAAAKALGEIGDKRGLDPLIVALTDDDIGLRQTAIQALGKIADPRAIEFLVRSMNDKDNNYSLHTDIANTLHTLGYNPSDPLELVDYLIAAGQWDELVKVGKPAADQLIAAMNAKNAYTQERIQIANTLLRAGIPTDELASRCEPGVDYLVAALTDSSTRGYQLNGKWVQALGWHGNKRAVRALIPALTSICGSTDYEDKICAIAEILGRIGDPQAVEPLIALLQLRDQPYRPAYRMRCAAVAALGALGDPRAVEPLITAFKNDTCDKQSVVEALTKIGIHQETKDTLITLLLSHGKIYEPSIAKCLGLLGWEPESEQDRLDCYLAKGDISGLKRAGRPALERIISLFRQIPKIPASKFLAHWDDFDSRLLRYLSDMGDEAAEELLMEELKGRGQFCKVARDIVNSRCGSNDHVLCPKCFTYLGIRNELVRQGTRVTAQTREAAKQVGFVIIGGEAHYCCPNCLNHILV